MKRSRTFLVLLFAALAAVWTLPPGMRAQSSNQAALVVRYGNNDVRTACISFDEPQITGYELLQQSGSDLELDVQGIGALVCSIDGTGCPARDCLCQCDGGGDCIYWSYWHRLQGTWQYSQGGAGVYAVEHGAVEGWSWGPGSVSEAIAPPDMTFEDVCESEPVNTATSTPTVTTAPPIVVNTPLPMATEDAVQPATATATPVTPTSTHTAQPTATPEQTWTPTTIRQQATATNNLVTTNTPTPTDITAGVELLTDTPTPLSLATRSEDGSEEDLVVVERATEIGQAAEEMETTAVPVVVAAAQPVEPDRLEATPLPNAQKIAKPVPEATKPLQVIGADAVTRIEIDVDQSTMSSEEVSGIDAAEMMPYLGFLVIVGGLAGLLGLVNLRRRRQHY